MAIFLRLARRNPVTGLAYGAFIGLGARLAEPPSHRNVRHCQDRRRIRRFVVGGEAHVENAGARFLVTLGFYLVDSAVYFTVARGLVNMTQNWSWLHGILAGLVNAFLGVMLYFLLDKLKHRT